MELAIRALKASAPLVIASAILLTMLGPAALHSWLPQHALSPRDPASAWFSLPISLALSGLCLVLSGTGGSGTARWLLAPLALLAPAEGLYVWHFGVPSGAHVFAVVAETNAEEVGSWIGADWPLYLACGLVWLGAVAWAFRRWRGNAWTLSLRGRLSLAALGLALLLPQALTAMLPDRLDAWVSEADKEADRMQHAFDGGRASFLQSMEATYPWGLPQRVGQWLSHRTKAREHAEAASGHRFRLQTSPETVNDAPLVVVMVVGEASRADRWSLYGASRSTSPRLQALRDELLVFENAVAGASATREAMTLMLTRRPPEEPLGLRSEGSVVTAFRQAGFKTYWLSTQGSAGAHETPVAVMAAEADERQFLSASDYRGRTALDGALLPPLQAILHKRESRVFVVLHTMGSHLHYANRYPVGREPFQPALQREEAPNIWRRQQVAELVNAYDNSIHYTDWVLDGVIQLLKQSGAKVHLSFMPDHGETLFDGDCPRGGHGFASIANYRVPLLMWASPGWKAQFAERWALLLGRQREPVSALATFPTLLGHAGIRLLDSVSHADLGASGWTASARPTNHFGDFDRDVAPKACDRKKLQAASP